jgi:hypothetical protein
MKLTVFIKKLLIGLYASIRRFPATLCFSAATAIMLIIINELEPTAGQANLDILRRIAMVLALGIPLSLCITHMFERKEGMRPAARILASLAGAAALVLYYFFLLPDFKMVPVTRYIAFSTALYITFVLLPYFYKRENFELYIMKLFIRFWITALYSGVLFAGMAAILFTIDKLLQIKVDEKMYLYVWFLIAGVFAPAFFLGGIPAFTQRLEKDDYSKLLRILLLYIIMPLITVYTVILYIYFAKAIITLEWPQGLVAHLVLWYSVISAAVIFLTSPLTEANKWVRTFIFWFIKLILPVLVIMFISIGIRINAYGITENRYFVVLLGLWVTGVMIYLNLTKSRRNIVMPISLAIIALLSVSGPWSAYSVSKLSQSIRFENILDRNDMISNNMVFKPSAEIAENDRNEISEILMYFSNNHNLSDLKYLPAEFKLENMEATFGFPLHQRGYQPEDGFFSFNINSMNNEAVDIKGYDYLFDFRNNYQKKSMKAGNLEIQYTNQEAEIKVFNSGLEIYKGQLSEFIRQLYEKHQGGDYNEVDQKEMTFTIQDAAVDMKIIIYNAYGRMEDATDKITIDGIDFIIMAKVK